jgi:metallophosphoesterase superfamily enzyme
MWLCNIFRYLYKTFQKAFAHVDPHVVVFLGDVMDEGSIATRDEYRRYMERFYDVFHVGSSAMVSTLHVGAEHYAVSMTISGSFFLPAFLICSINCSH